MSNYKLKQIYPGLPKSWEIGEELFFQVPIVGFSYYTDKFDTHRLRKEDVENNPNFFENTDIKPDILYKLQAYFDETPRNEVLKGWEEAKKNAAKNSPKLKDL